MLHTLGHFRELHRGFLGRCYPLQGALRSFQSRCKAISALRPPGSRYAILVDLRRDRLACGLEVYPAPRRVEDSRRNWTFY
jgi:hypothetical protein